MKLLVNCKELKLNKDAHASKEAGAYANKELLEPLIARAEKTAKRTNSEIINDESLISEGELFLYLDEEGLSLKADNLSVKGDFNELLSRVKKSNLEKETLVKATRLKNSKSPLTLLDATAGMGEDSFILAAAGFKVILYEYNPIICALLEDALTRAKNDSDLAHIAGRMELVNGDSIAAMESGEIKADVILLDPMFPKRTKSAMVKKKFQLLQRLESPCSEEKDMLHAAIKASPQKIVIKRPAKGPYLGELKPDYSIDGKAIRYDCIINVSGHATKLKQKI